MNALLLARPAVPRLAPALLHSVAPRISQHACHAKKKGGKKKGGQKKQGGSLMGEVPDKGKSEPWKSPDMFMQLFLAIESYRKAAGKALIEEIDVTELADELYNAPYGLLMHDRFSEGVADEDSVFTYANKACLSAFEADSWEEFVGTRSALCVADLDDSEAKTREANLNKAAESAAGDGAGDVVTATGKRRSVKGNTFTINEYQLWTIKAPTGDIMGQAAMFESLTLADGSVIFAGMPPIPTDDEVAAATAAVAEQGEAVRALKDGGKGNADEAVKEAVAELLVRKEKLAGLEAVLDRAASDREKGAATTAEGGADGSEAGGESAEAAMAGAVADADAKAA